MIYDTLTRREKEILDLICEGFSNEEIAQKLYLSYYTIASYLPLIYDKYLISGPKGIQRLRLVLKRQKEKSLT